MHTTHSAPCPGSRCSVNETQTETTLGLNRAQRGSGGKQGPWGVSSTPLAGREGRGTHIYPDLTHTPASSPSSANPQIQCLQAAYCTPWVGSPESGPKFRQALKINKLWVSWLRSCTYNMFLLSIGGSSPRTQTSCFSVTLAPSHPPAVSFPSMAHLADRPEQTELGEEALRETGSRDNCLLALSQLLVLGVS